MTRKKGNILCNCLVCGKEFYVYPSQIKYRNAGKYCSRACYDISRTEYKNCIICGKQFSLGREHKRNGVEKYCSLTCQKIGQSNPKTYICKYCGKEFQDSPSTNRKFCSKICFDQSRTMSVREYPKEFRKQRLFILEKYGEYCIICGRYSNIVHHVDYDKNNNYDMNLVVLCKSCHAKSNFERDYWEERINHIIGNW